MSTSADKLREARALIEDPERWCQGHFAVDAEGVPWSGDWDKAARWCASGAAFVVGVPDTIYLHRAARELFPGSSGGHEVNDKHGHSAVLRMYDRAIQLAEEGEG